MINQSPEINELATALSVAQGQLKDPKKDTQGYNYKYADLPATLETIRPVFHENGLSFTQMPSGGDDNFIQITTRLMHTSGQWLEATFSMAIELKKNMSASQCVGSTLTYARRYALQALAGIAADEDTDHADVVDRGRKPSMPKRKSIEIKNKGNGEIEITLADELIKQLEDAKSQVDLDAVAQKAQDIESDSDKDKVREAYGIRKGELTEIVH
jgi:hypothetical protein